MSDRQKLPPYIVALNIVMIVIFLGICGLVFALTMSAKDLGWELPTPDDSSAALSESITQNGESAQGEVSSEITVQASSAE